ncbi:peptidoglycan-binding domain-containing protein [Paracoccus versutus]|uniref:peptidoglycan-binding domain-containing protein n=1 Tax=Paracoccus versutus TaxID=34007 RepID=UPI000A694CB6|nr:peptidoglycan-binding domain-containing protein [Paracoccus versutus]
MRRFAFVIGAALPLSLGFAAQAEDVVIRIEAKRGTEAAAATARNWGAEFPDVVTFPLADGWVGIALGPMPREEAAARLEQLKQQRKVPGDSFLAAAEGRELTRIGDAAPEQFSLRLESTPDRARAEELLAKWRETLPEAGLWTLPGGRLAIGFGPMDRATGTAWLQAFRDAGAVPKDAFLAPGEEMGEIAIIGKVPDLGAPPAPDAAPVPMPPLEEIQRALRWAGHYDGGIDGKDGPKTRAAIAEEIVRLRASPDTATAMAELIRRREAWRAEMGLAELRDAHTGLMLPAPMEKLQFDRAERALSIYGPKDGSGAALILFSQPGGQQEMLDLAGLVTALGWVPAPERKVERGSVTLDGRNQTHIGHAEGRVVDGRVQGFVLIWPISDPEDQHRLAAEISDNLARFAPGATEARPEAPAIAPAIAQD